jgi:hypothetical protein
MLLRRAIEIEIAKLQMRRRFGRVAIIGSVWTVTDLAAGGDGLSAQMDRLRK